MALLKRRARAGACPAVLAEARVTVWEGKGMEEEAAADEEEEAERG